MSVFPKMCYSLPCKSYGGALQFLKSINPLLAKHQKLEKGISKPGVDALKNTDDLYELIGRPLDVIPTIHVAGTNGKGSTSFKLAEGLKFSGLRTGLCTGPHISSFRERMQVNGELVSESEVVNLLEKVVDLCAEHEIPATFFEIAFIMTCLHFQSMKCDVVVLEVGMGGRFDASNVISSELSVVTSIGMDHMNSLGGTLESIARHKAGIFKPNTASLVGPGCPLAVMEEESRITGSSMQTLYSYLRECSDKGLFSSSALDHPLFLFPQSDSEIDSKSSSATTVDTDSLGVDFDPDRLCSQLALASLCLLRNYPPSLPRLENRRAIFSIINLQDHNLWNILLNTRLPCRFEELFVRKEVPLDVGTVASESLALQKDVKNVNVKVVLDVAHNTPALAALMKKLHKTFNSHMRIVMGMSRGKGTQECLDIITQYVPADRIDFIQSDNHRAISPEELYEAVGNSGGIRSDGDVKAGGHVFNMVGGNIVSSRFNATHNTLHAVLNQIVQDSVSDQTISLEAEEGDVGVCRDVLVVCGTLYAMPHVRWSLGIREPNDAFDVDVTI